MKTKALLALIPAMLAAFLLPAAAATYHWDDGTVTVNGASGGGSGTWVVGGAGWEDGASAVNWADGNTAILGGTAGTLTLGGNISAAALTLGVSGYTVNSAGYTMAITGVMSGAYTFTYGGSGAFTLGGINSNTGNLTIDTATVTVNTGATLFCSAANWAKYTVTLQNGGTVVANNWENGAGNFWGQCGDDTNQITFGAGGGTFKMLGTTMNSGVNKGFTVNSGVTGHFYVPTGTSTTWSGEYASRDFYVNGGTLDFNGGGDFSTSREIRGSGNVTKSDGGTLTLSGVNGFSGALTVNGGTLVASAVTTGGYPSATGSGGATNVITVNSGATLKYTGSRGAGYHGANVNLNGGTITFDAVDMSFACGKTITFDTAAGTINGTGQLRRRDASNKVAVTVAASGSTISVAELNLYDNTPAFDIANGTADADLTISSLITGGAGLNKTNGAGKLVLSGTAASSNVGAITIGAGTLEINGRIGSGTTGTYTGAISNSGTLIYSNASSDQSMSGVLSGAGALTKSGAGSTLTLTGVNTYGGATTINAGTLDIGGAGQLGGGTYAGTISNAGTLKISSSADQTLSGSVNGAGAIQKTGGGTLTLSGGGSCSGSLTINSGTLVVGSSLASVTATSLAAGTHLKGAGTLGGTTTAAGGATLTAGDGSSGTLTLGNLTFNDTATVNIGALGNYTGGAAIAVTGTLTLSGSAITINLPAGPVLNGTYHLVGHANGLANIDGVAIGTGPTIGARQSATLTNNASSIDYVVSGDTPYWTGATSGDWDTTTKNWKLITAGTDTQYEENDTVLFNDSATGTTSVSIASDVNPASVAFNNSTLDYTLGGTAGIAGAAVVNKSGSGRLTINNPNSYSGGTTLAAGRLVLGNAGALGSGAVSLNGGTLDLNGLTLANNVALGGGAVSGNGGEISGIVSNGLTPSLTVTSDLTLSGINTYSGGTTLSSGRLVMGNAGALGSGAVSLNGGTLDLGGLTVSNNVSLGGGAVSGNGGTLSGILSNGTGSSLTVTSDLTLTGANTYTGATTISGGTLTLTGSAAGVNANGVTGTGSGALAINKTTGMVTLSGTVTTADGNQSYTVGNSGSYGVGLAVGASTVTLSTTNGGSITLNGYVGKYDSAGNTLALDTSSGNGTINLDISIGKISAWYNLAAFTANAGTGAINWTGSNAAEGSQTTPITLTGAINFASNFLCQTAQTLTLNATGASSVSGVLSGALTVVKGGSSTLTTSAANTFTGPLQVKNGTLEMTGGSWTGGTLGTERALNIGPSGGDNGTFKISGGALNLSTGNAANGIVVGDNGTGTFSQTGGTVTVGSIGIFIGNGSTSAAGTMTLSGGTLTSTSGATVVATRGAGTLSVSGTADVTLSSLQLGHSAGGSSTATVNLDGGTLTANSISLIAGTGRVYFDGGLLKAGAATTTFLQGLTSAEVKAGGAQIDTNSKDINIAQSLIENAGSTGGGLTKTGAGKLTLSGANTYTGATVVSNGVLSVTGSVAGAAEVATGATLSGTGTVGGDTTVNGTVSPGTTTPGALTVGGRLILNAAAALAYKWASPTMDVIHVGGALTLDGTLTVADLTTVPEGAYTIITYTGALTNNGLAITDPADGRTYTINTATAGQVKLVVSTVLTPYAQWWKDTYGIEPAPSEDGDYDGDGTPNGEEYAAKTNPTDNTSYLHLTNVAPAGNDLTVSVFTGGATYDLERTDDLLGAWTDIGDITGNDAIQDVTDPGAATGAQWFYRAKVK